MTTTRTDLMIQSAKSSLVDNAQFFLTDLQAFQARYPQISANINETLYSKVDMNLEDLVNLIQTFSEIIA